MKMVYNVKDKPPFSRLIVFSIQQLLAIMTATLVVPVIVGHDLSPAAALVGAGVGTVVYLLFTKFKSPVFLGSSFAFIGSMVSAFAGGVSAALGYLGLILGAVMAGLVYVVIAAIVKLVGVGWINRLMPAVVIGPTVAIIGLSLAGNAIGDLQSVNYVKHEDKDAYAVVESYNVVQREGGADYLDANGNVLFTATEEGDFVYLNDNGEQETATEEKLQELKKLALVHTAVDKESGEAVTGVTASLDDEGELNGFESKPGSVYAAILCGLVTLAVTMLCSTYGKKLPKLIPFIIGILSGYAFASVLYLIGNAAGIDALKIIDFSPFKNLSVFAVPNFTFLKAFGAFGELNGGYVASLAVAYVPVAFVVFAEHIADHKNLSSIIETDLLEEPGLHRTLLGDGVGSMVGALFGGCPNTTYGESVGCVAITKNASVYSILGAAVLSILVAFFTPFVAFVNSIPSCVMGGVCMALYGFIAVSGLKMVQSVDLNKNKNLFVVSTILVAGIGGLTVSFWKGKIEITAVACALILGILANLMLSGKGADKAEE